MSNPLVADVQSSTQSFTGISLLESANDLKTGIESGDWASVAMGAVGTALDALSTAMDPFGSILAAGVGWLMEHVGPLKEALDALAGDPDEIAAHSETWKNVAGELGSISEDLAAMVTADTAQWTGPAADAYRKRSADISALIGSAKEGCEGASSGVKTAGEVVAAVRSLVRDIIAELVGHLISWALQVLCTLGIAMAWVLPQVISAVAKTASQIADITGRLVKALKALAKLLEKAGGLFSDAAKSLRKIKPGKETPNTKLNDLPDGAKGGDKPKGDPGDTNPSGTGGSGGSGGGNHSNGSGGSGGGNGPDGNSSHGDGSSSGNGSSNGGKTDPSGSGKKDGAGNNEPVPHKPEPPRDRGVGSDDRVCESDPVDVATGDVVMTQLDLVIPGLPEVVLERTHISSYRAGRWFGPSWSSTVDERLEADDEHLCYFSSDGMILVYPHPAPGAEVLPLEGPRRPLRRDGEGYLLVDPLRQERRRFAATVTGSQRLPLVSLEHDLGYLLEVEHDQSGAPVLLRHSDGYRVRLHNNGSRITEIEVLDPDEGQSVRVARFGYDRHGELTGVINSSGKPMTYDYDVSGRLVGWQDRNGTWYRYVYDADGRCVRTVGPGGYFSGGFSYDRERLVTTYTDSLGNATEYHLNEANQLLRTVNPLGQATAYQWDRYDRLLSREDALGQVTGYRYHEDGRLAEVTRPDGSVVAVTENGDELSITVASGQRSWTREYTGAAIPDAATEQLGVSSTLDYRELAGTTRAAGVEAEDIGYRREVADRDLFGRARTLRNDSGLPVRLGWTVEGRQNLRVLPSGVAERVQHDPEGNELERVNGAGFRTQSGYGPFNLRTAHTDATGASTSYTYDTELRLVAVTDPRGLRWTYRYDPAGRLVEETDFDGRVLRFDYDAAGRLIRSMNGLGQVVEYGYDQLGNLVWRQTPDGRTSYTYDPVGLLVGASTTESELVVQRDELGRVLTETVNGRTLTFGYAAGAVHRRTPSEVDSWWSYDSGTPRRLEIAGRTVRFDHDAAGRELRRSVDEAGGATVLHSEYDGDDNLIRQAVTAAGTDQLVHERRFSYRADGLLGGTWAANTGTVQFGLDPVGRVTEVVAERWRESYHYDGAGNILDSGEWSLSTGDTANQPGGGQYQYRQNSLVAAGGIGYEYDRQGRMVRRTEPGSRSWLYTWNADDRLTSVTGPDGEHWTYHYDPLGRRIAKRRLVRDPATGAPVVAEQYDFTWDGGLLVEQLHSDATGRWATTTWEYHPEQDRPIVQLERHAAAPAPRFLSVVTGLLGTPTELVEPNGALAWQGQSSLWGRQRADLPQTASTPLRFPGQYADAESGLHYNVYRYYDPGTGRYLSQDPLGLGPAPNPVTYVTNPHSMSDPLGLMPKPKGKGKKGECGNGAGDTPNRPGNNDANNLPSGSKNGAGGKSDQKKVGNFDGIDVHVDSHQNKHHPGGGLYANDLNQHTTSQGTKFPSNVREDWHEKYFGPEAGRLAKGETDKVDANINNLRNDANDAKTKADDSAAEAAEKQKQADAAKFADKQYHNDSSKANADQQAAEAKEAQAKAVADQKAADKAEKDAAEAERKRDEEPLNFKNKPTDDYNVTYDMVMGYDKDTGRWNATYHCYPADDNTTTWWKNHGREMQRKIPGLS